MFRRRRRSASESTGPESTGAQKGPEAPSAVGLESGDSGETFLSRWSRRKLGQEELAPPALNPQDSGTPTAGEAAPPHQPTDVELPPLEMLDENSDYSGFLSPQVTGDLRKLALRKLFQSAKFNVTDGLDDYDDDFRTFAALGDMLTADMRHRLEQEADKARASLAEGTPDELVEEGPTAEPDADRDSPPEPIAGAPGDSLAARSRDDPDAPESQR